MTDSEYERRSAAFQDDIKKSGHLAATKMIPLMIMDIAFLKAPVAISISR